MSPNQFVTLVFIMSGSVREEYKRVNLISFILGRILAEDV